MTDWDGGSRSSSTSQCTIEYANGYNDVEDGTCLRKSDEWSLAHPSFLLSAGSKLDLIMKRFIIAYTDESPQGKKIRENMQLSLVVSLPTSERLETCRICGGNNNIYEFTGLNRRQFVGRCVGQNVTFDPFFEGRNEMQKTIMEIDSKSDVLVGNYLFVEGFMVVGCLVPLNVDGKICLLKCMIRMNEHVNHGRGWNRSELETALRVLDAFKNKACLSEDTIRYAQANLREYLLVDYPRKYLWHGSLFTVKNTFLHVKPSYKSCIDSSHVHHHHRSCTDGGHGGHPGHGGSHHHHHHHRALSDDFLYEKNGVLSRRGCLLDGNSGRKEDGNSGWEKSMLEEWGMSGLTEWSWDEWGVCDTMDDASDASDKEEEYDNIDFNPPTKLMYYANRENFVLFEKKCKDLGFLGLICEHDGPHGKEKEDKENEEEEEGEEEHENEKDKKNGGNKQASESDKGWTAIKGDSNPKSVRRRSSFNWETTACSSSTTLSSTLSQSQSITTPTMQTPTQKTTPMSTTRPAPAGGGGSAPGTTMPKKESYPPRSSNVVTPWTRVKIEQKDRLVLKLESIIDPVLGSGLYPPASTTGSRDHRGPPGREMLDSTTQHRPREPWDTYITSRGPPRWSPPSCAPQGSGGGESREVYPSFLPTASSDASSTNAIRERGRHHTSGLSGGKHTQNIQNSHNLSSSAGGGSAGNAAAAAASCAPPSMPPSSREFAQRQGSCILGSGSGSAQGSISSSSGGRRLTTLGTQGEEEGKPIMVGCMDPMSSTKNVSSSAAEWSPAHASSTRSSTLSIPFGLAHDPLTEGGNHHGGGGPVITQGQQRKLRPGDLVELHSFPRAIWLCGLRARVKRVLKMDRRRKNRERRVTIEYEDPDLHNDSKYLKTVPMTNIRFIAPGEEK